MGKNLWGRICGGGGGGANNQPIKLQPQSLQGFAKGQPHGPAALELLLHPCCLLNEKPPDDTEMMKDSKCGPVRAECV